ncbi:hypothetical protein AB0M02_05095 [Actinoplanes sp. NPDC051861]|uniref:hypothetical protein n=1 Tax=Actinoplanes sp. NPDC051861 TaxID=3155170 RepID=UPI00342D94C4
MAADGLWNWSVAARVGPDLVRGALAGALERPVHEMVPAGELLCDVYHVGGDFPTVVDVFLAPSDVTEATIASAVAVRLHAAVLLPDDSLDASRYILAEPDGTLRPVHVDEEETDDGTERRGLRPCDGCEPACTPGRPAAA